MVGASCRVVACASLVPRCGCMGLDGPGLYRTVGLLVAVLTVHPPTSRNTSQATDDRSQRLTTTIPRPITALLADRSTLNLHYTVRQICPICPELGQAQPQGF